MLSVLVLALTVAGAAPPALDRAIALNLAVPDLMTPAMIDSVLAAERDLAVPARIGRWARRYLAWSETEYRFGLAAGGYAAEGLLVAGKWQDCISLLYRTTELARAADARDAVRIALATRFAGADPEQVVGPDGQVDYDRAEHLDYSLDMVRSGRWGADVTPGLTGAALDLVGSSRYPPGSFCYVPETALDPAELREGDLAWLVLDPDDKDARALRAEHGLVIGHVGIVIRDDTTALLVHAASWPLPGWYGRTGVVSVPILTYLERVERYSGVVITRFSLTGQAPAQRGSPGPGR
ncbi:MAG TPA: hypothetical protein PLL30_02250 [Candidatus Krumholzibacteria bacterium]|nr:hypothetical protein [Candidatus Krumholzibacteria bacterium]HPD70589.1 hypothetical protein [Candidatus Krumholzibacteria bacterium]HRY39711.1 hypothetical protein [Candidatus Krumholzibacteria bacterium]